MSVDETHKVDIISRDKNNGVWLIISDHLPWGDPKHLWTLQEKLNTYFTFMESGQIREHASDVAEVGIKIVMRFPPDQAARDFLFQVGQMSGKAGYPLTCEVRSDD